LVGGWRVGSSALWADGVCADADADGGILLALVGGGFYTRAGLGWFAWRECTKY